MKQQLLKSWLLALFAVMSVANAWADATVGTAAELKTAIEGLTDGNQTITLGAKITLTENITCSHSFTLALGSYSITKGNYSIALADDVTVKVQSRVTYFSTSTNGYEICRKKLSEGGYSYTPAKPYVKFTTNDTYFASLKDAVDDYYYSSFTLLDNVTLTENVEVANSSKTTSFSVTLGSYSITAGEYKIVLHADKTAKFDKAVDFLALYEGETGTLRSYTNNGEYCYEFCNAKEAKVGDTEYDTFAAAASAAGENTITLLRKVVDTYTMTSSSQTLKVAKNGYSVTVVGYAGYIASSSTANGITTYTQSEANFEYILNETSTYKNTLSLTEASGTTVKLLKDYTTTTWLTCGTITNTNRNVTLDLNGKTLSVNTSNNTKDHCFLVQYGCTLTVKNGTIEMTPTSSAKSNGFRVEGGAKLIVASDAIINAHDVSAVTVLGTSTLETAGTLTADGNTFTVCGNGSSGQGGYTINITGGSVTSAAEAAIYHPNSGTVTISGGSITGTTGVYQKSGTLNITGGSITGNGAVAEYVFNGNGANSTGDAVVIDNCGYPGGTPAPAISGGTFSSTNAKAVASYAYGDGNEPVAGFISGGSFTTNVNDLAASNMMAIQVGENYVVYSVETTTNKDTAEEHQETMTVKDGDTTKKTITVSVKPTSDESTTSAGDVALSQVNVTNVIDEVMAVTDLGTDATINVSVELRVNVTNTPSVETTGETKKMTFDVKPQAIVKVNSTEKEPVDISNDQLTDGAKFDFTLDVTDLSVAAGGQVKVVHKSSDSATYPDETFMATVTEKESKKLVTITTTHFSEFEVSNSTVSVEDDVTLTDGVTTYDITSDVAVKSATYVRSFDAARVDKYQAWLVPFDYTITAEDVTNFDFFKINMIANAPDEGTDADPDRLWIFVESVTTGATLHANMPYVFRPKSVQTNYQFKTTSATLKAKKNDALIQTQTMANNYNFYATYDNTTATAGDPFYYISVNGKICKGTSVTVGAYRWIIKATSKSISYSPLLSFDFVEGDGTEANTTGIEVLDTEKHAEKSYYNLNGMEMKSPGKGVRVIRSADGKVSKVIIK